MGIALPPRDGLRPAGSADRETETAAPSKPVLLWAALGAVALATILVGWLRWVTGDSFTSPDPGPDTWATWREVGALTLQYTLLASALWVIWRHAVRGLVRHRTVGFDARLVLAGCLCGFWEACTAYLNAGHQYNAHLTNFGSWAEFIPGWRTPNAEMIVTPVIFVFAMYVWFIAGFAFVLCAVLSRMRHRFPRWSTLSCFGVIYLIAAALTFVFEQGVIHTQVYIYPVVPEGGALWAGELYQYPLQSPISGGLVVTALTALRWSHQQHGVSFVERGIGAVHRFRGLLATLAVLGYASLAVVALWMIPHAVFVGMQGSSGVDQPSYISHGVCGPGTDYACPGGLVPVPSRDSLAIGPDDPRLGGGAP